MPCKKSELVTAINSYASARSTQDTTLISMAASLLQNMVDSLAFSAEEEASEAAEAAEAPAEEGAE